MSDLFSQIDLITAKVIFERGYPRTEEEFDAMVDESVARFGELVTAYIVGEVISGGNKIALPFQLKAE